MLLSLPALGWAGASFWSLLLCLWLPAALLYSTCLFLLCRCRFRLRLLSVYCLPTPHDWSASWLVSQWMAAGALYAPFALLPVALLSLCFTLLAVLPALFAACVVALLVGCAASGALLCYCAARHWQSDRVTTRSLRAVCALFTCIALTVPPLRLGSSFVGWSCLFVGCNSILMLRLVYAARPNLPDSAAAALALPPDVNSALHQLEADTAQQQQAHTRGSTVRLTSTRLNQRRACNTRGSLALPCMLSSSVEAVHSPGASASQPSALAGLALSSATPTTQPPSTSWSHVRLTVEYMLSVACLVAYSAVLARLSFGYLAALLSVCLLVLDVVLALIVSSRLSHRPGVAGCLVLSSRLCVCGFGEQWYLAGHTVLFVGLSLYVWSLIMDNAAPTRLTRIVPPFSSSAQQPAGATSLTCNEPVQKPQKQMTSAESDLAEASSFDSSVLCTAAPPLPADWPVPAPVPQSFTRLPLLVVALWLLWLLFAADVFASYELLTVDSSLLTPSSSGSDWANSSTTTLLTASPLCVALAGVLLTVELMTLFLLWRWYYNAHFSITAGCWLLLAVCYGPVLAAAVALQTASSELAPLWLSLCIAFVPALVLHSVHILCQWRLRDFRVAVQASYMRHLQCRARLTALERRNTVLAVRRFDASMVWGCSVQAALVIGLSAALAALCSPWHAGVTVLLSLCTLHFTAIPLLRWFHSFQWTRATSLQCVGACVCLLSVCLLQFICGQHEQLTSTSFLLLLLLFLYPTVVCLVLAVCKWRDDGWLLTGFTVWCLLVGVLSLVLFCFLVAVLFPPWYAGAGLLLSVVSLLLLLLHALPTVHSHHTAPSASSATTLAARVCVLLLSVVSPVVVGVYYSDVWLAFTAACVVLLVLCTCQLLSCVHSLHSAVSPVSALTPAWLSSVCSPRRQYVVVDGGSVLGVWLVHSLSSATDSNIAPPRPLRGAVLFAYCLFGVLFVWGHLSLFFPPAAVTAPSPSSPSYSTASLDESNVPPSVDTAVSVSAALIAASCCAAFWLTLHLAHMARQQAMQFECERDAVQRVAASGGGRPRIEASKRRPPAAAVAWEARAAVEESAEADSAAMLSRGLWTAARARARKCVPEVESFGTTRSDNIEKRSPHSLLQPAHTRLLLGAIKPLRASSINKVRPAPSPSVGGAVAATCEVDDELLSFAQSFHSLIHSSAISSICSRAEYDSACRLHDRYMVWSSERRLFGCCQSVQLHHLLTLALHDQINDTAAMCAHFETQQDEADDRRGSERRRDRVSALYVALLSLHRHAAQQLSPSSSSGSIAPSKQWSQYSIWLTQWRSHRTSLLFAARQRRQTRDEAAVRRQQTVATAAERQLNQTREAIAQRRAERRKVMQACELSREVDEEAAGEQQQRSDRAAAAFDNSQSAVSHVKQQAGRRRRSNRNSHKRPKQQQTSQQQPEDVDADTRAAELTCDTAITATELAIQRPQRGGVDDAEAVGAVHYQYVAPTVRRAAQPRIHTRKGSRADSTTDKHVRSSRHSHNSVAPHSRWSRDTAEGEGRTINSLTHSLTRSLLLSDVGYVTSGHTAGGQQVACASGECCCEWRG